MKKMHAIVLHIDVLGLPSDDGRKWIVYVKNSHSPLDSYWSYYMTEEHAEDRAAEINAGKD